jgi:hypothetical protein
MAASDDITPDTLSLLEDRLRRIDYVINGHNPTVQDSTPHVSAPVSTRLRTLERAINGLASRSHTVTDVLRLQKQCPELFHTIDDHAVPSTLHPASLAQLILAHENLYKTASAQLSTLNENNPIPDSAPLTKLISLQPRIEKAEAKQAEQAREFAELRLRSTRLLEKWYELGVLEMGENWTDWEERLRECEILIRRKEATKRREEGTL